MTAIAELNFCPHRAPWWHSRRFSMEACVRHPITTGYSAVARRAVRAAFDWRRRFQIHAHYLDNGPAVIWRLRAANIDAWLSSPGSDLGNQEKTRNGIRSG